MNTFFCQTLKLKKKHRESRKFQKYINNDGEN